MKTLALSRTNEHALTALLTATPAGYTLEETYARYEHVLPLSRGEMVLNLKFRILGCASLFDVLQASSSSGIFVQATAHMIQYDSSPLSLVLIRT